MNDKLKPEDHASIQRSYVPAVELEEVEEQKHLEIAEKRKHAESKIRAYMFHNQAIEGIVKHVNLNHNREMNFAFITPHDTLLDDIFVHHSEIEPWRDGFKELRKNDKVRFKIAPGKNGKYQAVNVEILRNAQRRIYNPKEHDNGKEA